MTARYRRGRRREQGRREGGGGRGERERERREGEGEGWVGEEGEDLRVAGKAGEGNERNTGSPSEKIPSKQPALITNCSNIITPASLAFAPPPPFPPTPPPHPTPIPPPTPTPLQLLLIPLPLPYMQGPAADNLIHWNVKSSPGRGHPLTKYLPISYGTPVGSKAHSCPLSSRSSRDSPSLRVLATPALSTWNNYKEISGFLLLLRRRRHKPLRQKHAV